jgi:hypothetical protein
MRENESVIFIDAAFYGAQGWAGNDTVPKSGALFDAAEAGPPPRAT